MNTPLQLTTETTAPASAAFSSASLLTQVGGGLVIVLMIFVVAALLFKRFQLFPADYKATLLFRLSAICHSARKGDWWWLSLISNGCF